MNYCEVNVIINTEKTYNCTMSVNYNDDLVTNIPIKDINNNPLNKPIPAGKLIKFIWINSEGCFYIISNYANQIKSSKMIHQCKDRETTISFSNLDYTYGACIQVYRNGIRLFEDIDYSIDHGSQEITLFVRTELNETIIFEALSL